MTMQQAQINFGTALSISGALTLNATAAARRLPRVQASQPPGLGLLGTSATYTLTGANTVGTLAASDGTGSVSFTNGSNNLAIGTVKARSA